MTATVYVPPFPVAVDEAPPRNQVRVRGHVPTPGDVLVDATGTVHRVQQVTPTSATRAEARCGIRRVLAECDTTTLEVRVDRRAPVVLSTAS